MREHLHCLCPLWAVSTTRKDQTKETEDVDKHGERALVLQTVQDSRGGCCRCGSNARVSRKRTVMLQVWRHPSLNHSPQLTGLRVQIPRTIRTLLINHYGPSSSASLPVLEPQISDGPFTQFTNWAKDRCRLDRCFQSRAKGDKGQPSNSHNALKFSLTTRVLKRPSRGQNFAHEVTFLSKDQVSWHQGEPSPTEDTKTFMDKVQGFGACCRCFLVSGESSCTCARPCVSVMWI